MGIRTSNYIEFLPLNYSNNNNNNTKYISNFKRHNHFNYINHINNNNNNHHYHINKNIIDDNEDFTTFINQRLRSWDNTSSSSSYNYNKDNITNQFDQYILTRLSNHPNNNNKFIPPHHNDNIYGCQVCKTQLSSTLNIMSKDYRGITGDAYLMSNVINVKQGKYELRTMITGDYLVCDIMCQMCGNLVGWKYINAERVDQRYKEGQFILELKTITIVE